MIKNYFRILKKTHAYLQAILKAHVKFQKDWPKTVGGVKGTKYLLPIDFCNIRTQKMSKFWLCWGLTTRQPLWVILCRLPEKGRKEIEEIVEEMKETIREEIGTGMKVKKQKK